MYIIYSGKSRQYASIAKSFRKDGKTHISYTYLGKVLDRDAGVYENTEKGIFTYDLSTDQYGTPPENFCVKQVVDHVAARVSIDFGDGFFFNEVLYKSGLMNIIENLHCKNKDTLKSMVVFYALSNLSNNDAIHWYSGNIIRLLYPHANLKSQRISEFLSEIGTHENQMLFQKEYIDFVINNYNSDKNILIDSTGLPNNIHFPLTCKNIHNGKVNNEIRLIFVVQKSTGLPLFYHAVPGNIVDVSTLERIFLHLEALGINIDSCILDAGYNSDENLDLFYDDYHNYKVGFIIRIKSNNVQFKSMIDEELVGLDQKENFVKYEDRYLFIKKRKIFVGTNKKNPAWLYLGLDRSRMHDEFNNLVKRAKKKNLSNDEVYESIRNEGLFGILSNKNYSCDEILPAYYQRQAAEQIFDFSKNYTKLLPIRTYTEETFRGHLLLSYIASCAVKIIQLRLQVANLFFGSRLSFLRNQKCTIYKTRLITDPPQKEANATFQCFQIDCPKKIDINNEHLIYTPPAIDIASILPRIFKKAENPSNTEDTNKSSELKISESENQDALLSEERSVAKRGRGRPLGSKNKKTLEREALAANEPQVPKRGRGRPLGSKNKKTLEREALADGAEANTE